MKARRPFTTFSNRAALPDMAASTRSWAAMLRWDAKGPVWRHRTRVVGHAGRPAADHDCRDARESDEGLQISPVRSCGRERYGVPCVAIRCADRVQSRCGST